MLGNYSVSFNNNTHRTTMKIIAYKKNLFPWYILSTYEKGLYNQTEMNWAKLSVQYNWENGLTFGLVKSSKTEILRRKKSQLRSPGEEAFY